MQALCQVTLDHAVLGCSGAGYHIFAGKEVSRALAKMSLVEEDCNGKLDDLTKHQLEVLTGKPNFRKSIK